AENVLRKPAGLPGDGAFVVEEAAVWSVVGQSGEPECDRGTLLGRARCVESDEVGRDVSAAASVDNDIRVGESAGVRCRDAGEHRLRWCAGAKRRAALSGQ